MKEGAGCLASVSVIVCTFRRDEVLCNTLRSIIKQAEAYLELIVVDQVAAHDLKTTDFLRSAEQSHLIYYINLSRPGLTTARNVAASKARGEILLFCDDDIVPSPSLVRAHVSNYADPRIDAVAGQVLHINENAGYAPGQFLHDERVEHFDQLYGANFSVRKRVFLAVGGCDEKLGIHAYTEDVLLARTLLTNAKRIVYDPCASVLHLKHAAGGCRITDAGQPTSEADRSHSKLYLFHLLRMEKDQGCWHAFRDALRHGPLRRENVVRIWRQPWAWWSFYLSYYKALKDARQR
jgi:glycosyltransferase involved in cell wall biosynthesis